MDHFESPKFLIRQTGERLDELKAIFETMFAKGKGRNVVEVDPKTGNKTYKVKFDGSIPESARHIAATAIVDLRHALDQATCATVEALTGQPAGKDVYFPIATNKKDLEGRLRKPGMPVEIQPLFLGFESYPTKDGKRPGNDLLCALAKAAQGKHRVSCQVEGVATQIGLGHFAFERAVSYSLVPEWDTAKNEMIIGTTYPDGYIDAQIQISFFVSLQNAGPLSRTPAVRQLQHACRMVNRIVSAIEAETNRILTERA